MSFIAFLIVFVLLSAFLVTRPKVKASGRIMLATVSFFVALVVAAFVADCYVYAEAGHAVAYQDAFRGVLTRVDGPGLHFKWPLIQRAKIFVTQTQAYTMSIAPAEGDVYGDDSLEARTTEGQTVWIDITVFFNIDKEDAPILWQSVGDDYVQKIVRPHARGEVRMIISSYTAEDLYSGEKRAEAQTAMEEALRPIYAEKGINLERIALRNVTFSADYSSELEAIQVAQQSKRRAEFDLERKEIEKDQKIVEAEGDAEAVRILGQKLKANPAVIQYEFVQKLAPNISWGILPEGNVPILDLGSLISGQSSNE